MNSASLPISILLVAFVYLIGIYSLLAVAQIFGARKKMIASNPKEVKN